MFLARLVHRLIGKDFGKLKILDIKLMRNSSTEVL